MAAVLIIIGIIIALVVISAIFVVSVYNRLITLRNRVKNGFGQIDVQLQRRYDLIPNLVETAKGYLKHERETLDAVTQARNQALGAAQAAAAHPESASAMQQLSGAETALTGMLGRLFAVSEAYPDLKADTQMTQLQEELTSTENRVSFARQAFNDFVLAFNNARETFPNNVISGMFNFQEAAMFEVQQEEAREAVAVSFS